MTITNAGVDAEKLSHIAGSNISEIVTLGNNVVMSLKKTYINDITQPLHSFLYLKEMKILY